MIKAEYLRFMQAINTDAVPAEVRKLANLVLLISDLYDLQSPDYFDHLI